MTRPPSDFDARARTWDEDASKVERAQRVAAAIASVVPSLSGKAVLEYGAGTGLLGLALQPLVREVTLADSSREMLAVAGEKIASGGVRNARTLYLDLAAGPPPDLRFDLVCSLMTLHHIPDTDGVLGAFHRLLERDGVLCIADLDAEDGSFHGPGFSGHKGFERADLGARMERSGFRNVRFSTVHEVVRETADGARAFPVFLAIAERA
ncbi:MULTISPECIES: class I SAM-dependent methyltransferase [Anaeromyxobacter]|uniref:class I SAM-dependent DNA methyltransferase n=1 Tax=Anaeromyxobacter TaxID=161492 RepID=UPI001F55D6FC|nr:MULTISPECIES: class I SAM-dependent methyltransferase [unclassified Anaeromyxobacter]